ncbi:MAG: sigma-70 family RNA polymerase sigma factor [Phycisphaerales bacterium]|nr:sigma-70 family RNA polymerase sigma factor [Phycisphaerales bacterium]
MPNLEDARLMSQVAAGDQGAVEALYDRFGGLVFRIARQLLPTSAEAEDAVQEVFLRLWKTADRFDPERAKLVTWVILLSRRHVIDRLRRKSSRPKTVVAPEDAIPGEAPSATKLERDEAGAGLRRAVATLPQLQRVVIEKAYFHGFTLREISVQMDLPLGTVKSALSRGLGRLRDRVDPGDIAESAAS